MVRCNEVVFGTQYSAYGVDELGNKLFLAASADSPQDAIPVNLLSQKRSGRCVLCSTLDRNKSFSFGETVS